MASRDMHIRIGELSRRVGASPELLRVWERRYGVLRPARTDAGYRLYSDDDVRRATEMQAHLARGLAPAQAAELAQAAPAAEAGHTASLYSAELLTRLRETLDRYDGAGGERLLDRSFLNLGLATALETVILPYLHELGERWAAGEISVAEEHFASNVVRRRILRVAEGWDRGGGPIALLACAPGEAHDIGLICFGVALHSYHGWRIKFLGADTPFPDLVRAARVIRPDLVAASAVSAARFFSDLASWREFGADFRIAIGGAGASARLARRMAATLLSGDPVEAAARVAAPPTDASAAASSASDR
jgi:MerR family transcriptional regulator, light-induced transcriptional regulator